MSTFMLRPRSAIEIIDAAFQLLRAEYAVLVATSAVILAPGIFLTLVLPGESMVVGQLVSQLLQLFAAAATIVLVSERYLGREPKVAAAVRAVLSRPWTLLATSVFQGLLVVVGLLLLIVPGLIFAAWAFAMPMVVMVEHANTSQAFTRSRELARGEIGHVLGTLLLTFLIFYLVVIALVAVLGMLFVFAGLSERMGEVLSQVGMIVAYPLVGVAGTLLYYDLRIRKEGFDLETMARELEGSPAPAPVGAPR